MLVTSMTLSLRWVVVVRCNVEKAFVCQLSGRLSCVVCSEERAVPLHTMYRRRNDRGAARQLAFARTCTQLLTIETNRD